MPEMAAPGARLSPSYKTRPCAIRAVGPYPDWAILITGLCCSSEAEVTPRGREVPFESHDTGASITPGFASADAPVL